MYKGVSVTSRSLHGLCQGREPLVQPGVISLETWKQIQAQEKVACQHTWARNEAMPCSKGDPEPSLIAKGPALIYLQISHDIFHVSQLPHSTFVI